MGRCPQTGEAASNRLEVVREAGEVRGGSGRLVVDGRRRPLQAADRGGGGGARRSGAVRRDAEGAPAAVGHRGGHARGAAGGGEGRRRRHGHGTHGSGERWRGRGGHGRGGRGGGGGGGARRRGRRGGGGREQRVEEAAALIALALAPREGEARAPVEGPQAWGESVMGSRGDAAAGSCCWSGGCGPGCGSRTREADVREAALLFDVLERDRAVRLEAVRVQRQRAASDTGARAGDA